MRALVVVLAIFAGQFGFTAPQCNAEQPAEYPLLEQLTLPEETLPAGCKIVEFPADTSPIPGLRNRAITKDPKTFVIGDERLKKLINPEEVEARYLAIYKEKRNLGLYGWAFKTEDAAKETHKKLAESYANEPERFKFWLVKNEVVMLGRDPGTTAGCFQHFEKFIQEQVENLEKQ